MPFMRREGQFTDCEKFYNPLFYDDYNKHVGVGCLVCGFKISKRGVNFVLKYSDCINKEESISKENEKVNYGLYSLIFLKDTSQRFKRQAIK